MGTIILLVIGFSVLLTLVLIGLMTLVQWITDAWED